MRAYLKELEDAKFLEVKQRGLGKTNLYRLFLTVKKRGQLRTTVPDRQNLPVQNGKGFRPGAAEFADHSIEEYAFENTKCQTARNVDPAYCLT